MTASRAGVDERTVPSVRVRPGPVRGPGREMESALHTRMRRTVTVGLGMLTLAVAGCGDNSTYKNENRPPSPITVTASISDRSVSVSPSKFGAGPVNLVIANESGSAQRVTFESDGSSAGFRHQTGPINPGAPTTLVVDVPTGAAVLRVGDSGIQPARVTVGAKRPSAQNELLQP